MTSSSSGKKEVYHKIVIYGYLERDKDKTLKFHTNDSFYSEINASLLNGRPPISITPQNAALIRNLIII